MLNDTVKLSSLKIESDYNKKIHIIINIFKKAYIELIQTEYFKLKNLMLLFY